MVARWVLGVVVAVYAVARDRTPVADAQLARADVVAVIDPATSRVVDCVGVGRMPSGSH